MELKFTFANYLKYCLSSHILICSMKHGSPQQLLHENFSTMVSVVGIATRYVLDGPGIESRRGARYSSPAQTGPVPHPASCTMGTRTFQRVDRQGRGVALATQLHLAPTLKKK